MKSMGKPRYEIVNVLFDGVDELVRLDIVAGIDARGSFLRIKRSHFFI
jgi:hypothetical protein